MSTTAAIQITNRHTGEVLFEGEAGMSMIATLKKALAEEVDLTKANLQKANLRGADLAGFELGRADLSDADLFEANLSGANLHYANLRSANLRNADLRNAALEGADLSGASLSGAILQGADLADVDMRSVVLDKVNLSGVDLTEVKLGDKKLVGRRPYFVVGPVGAMGDYVHAWSTDAGLMVQVGCFYGSRAECDKELDEKYGDTPHGPEYRAALVPIDKHHAMWADK